MRGEADESEDDEQTAGGGFDMARPYFARKVPAMITLRPAQGKAGPLGRLEARRRIEDYLIGIRGSIRNSWTFINDK